MKSSGLFALLAAIFGAPALHAQTATPVWATRYDGPASPSNADYAVATVVDGAGNVIVTGQSIAANGHEDYYTAKYAAADGALLWEQRSANGFANSVAVDSAGNVIVTGASTDSDYYTVKYAAANGALLWEKRYNGPANGVDGARSVAVDSAGNVAVTGSSYNASGNPYYYTAKYAAASGALLWEKRYNGPVNFSDEARSIAVDSAGNVIVTGESYNSSFNSDYYTAKYAAASGALLWEKRYNGPGSDSDSAYSVAVDSAGNVFVTGASFGGSFDYYTAKYAAANGALLWEKRYDGPGNNEDGAISAKVDSAGNVVVTGYSWNGSNNDYYTVKYAATDGHLLWEARYDGPAHNTDWMGQVFPTASFLALTADGGAVVTGQSSNGTDFDYATVKYAPPAGDAEGDGLQDWWEQMWWGTTDGHSAHDDFDHDGIPELLEMAFGLNPKKSDALPPVVNEGGYLSITITKHPGVTYEVQTADAPAASAFSPATTTVLVDDSTTLKVRDNILIGTPPARYLRVKVNAVP